MPLLRVYVRHSLGNEVKWLVGGLGSAKFEGWCWWAEQYEGGNRGVNRNSAMQCVSDRIFIGSAVINQLFCV